MFKKVLIVTLSLMCVLCGCTAGNSAGTASGQDATAPVGGDFRFYLSEVSCKAGETCTVELWVSANSQVAASDLIIEFDSENILFQGFEGGSVYQSEAAEQTPGKVKVTSITLNPSQEETLMGTLTFKAANTASGKYDLKLTSETCANIDLVDMTPVCFKGSVTVE